MSLYFASVPTQLCSLVLVVIVVNSRLGFSEASAKTDFWETLADEYNDHLPPLPELIKNLLPSALLSVYEEQKLSEWAELFTHYKQADWWALAKRFPTLYRLFLSTPIKQFYASRVAAMSNAEARNFLSEATLLVPDLSTLFPIGPNGNPSVNLSDDYGKKSCASLLKLHSKYSKLNTVAREELATTFPEVVILAEDPTVRATVSLAKVVVCDNGIQTLGTKLLQAAWQTISGGQKKRSTPIRKEL